MHARIVAGCARRDPRNGPQGWSHNAQSHIASSWDRLILRCVLVVVCGVPLPALTVPPPRIPRTEHRARGMATGPDQERIADIGFSTARFSVLDCHCGTNSLL